MPPRRARRPLPIVLLLCLILLSATPYVHAQRRWERMEYGPFLASSVTMPGADPEDPKGIVEKGITIRLREGDQTAAVCFDTDLLSYAGGWAGGWLKLMGTPFDGTHRPPEGSRPAPAGKMVFGASGSTPGWAEPAGAAGGFDDPRPRPYGPLPARWAKYKGLYVHGDRVVLSYSVGGCDVLETPEFAAVGGVPVFLRTFRVAPTERPLVLNVSDARTTAGETAYAVTASNDAEGLSSATRDGRHLITVPPSKLPTVFRVAVTRAGEGAQDALREIGAREVDDPGPLTKGGLARYAQAVTTRGTLGSGEGPYVVDTITLPDDNPWKSWMRPGGFDFFSDGKRAAVSTWSGDVWVVSGIDDHLDELTWRRFASGLFQPLGLKIVDDVVYALGRDGITRLHDLNDDGGADFYECFNNDVEVTPNFHEFAADLHTDPEGNFYFTKGAPLLGTQYFDPAGAHNGCVLRVSGDGKRLGVYATGLRAPNGAGVGPGGQVTCGDNQGIWVPACRINLVKPGGFYGVVGMHHRPTPPESYDPPVCWLPMAVDNSSGGQAWVTGDKWGPFGGEMLHLSYGKGKLFHVLTDLDAGGAVRAGGVVRFPLNFASGVMRGRFNPADGQLYVAGLKGWQTDGALDGCLQRVRYTGKPVHSLSKMRVVKDGVRLTFTRPLDAGSAADADNYSAEWWNYRWTKEYGSPEFKVSKPDQQGHDAAEIRSAKISDDGRTVTLEIPGLRPVMQIAIKLNIESADGTPIEQEFYGTIHQVP